MSSRGTGRAWYWRTLRLLFNSVAKSPARADNVSAASGRIPASVVVTLFAPLMYKKARDAGNIPAALAEQVGRGIT